MYILFLIVPIVMVIALGTMGSMTYKRNTLPLQKSEAVVVSKRTRRGKRMGKVGSIGNSHRDYYITFSFEGITREFKVLREHYESFNEGDKGTLSYKEGFFFGFEK